MEKTFSQRYSTNHYPDDPIKSALWDYVSGYTSDINNKLKKKHYNQVKDVCFLLDQAFVEKQYIDVWRTVELSYLQYYYNINISDEQSVKDFVSDKPRLINKGYMSTASIKESPWMSGWYDSQLLLHITSDFKYPCIDINKVFSEKEIDCSDQHEILLPRNTEIQITGYSYEKLYHIWILEAKIINSVNENLNAILEYQNVDNITTIEDLLDNNIISQSEYKNLAIMIEKFDLYIHKYYTNKKRNELISPEKLKSIIDILYEMKFLSFDKIIKCYQIPNINILPYIQTYDDVQRIIDNIIEIKLEDLIDELKRPYIISIDNDF